MSQPPIVKRGRGRPPKQKVEYSDDEPSEEEPEVTPPTKPTKAPKEPPQVAPPPQGDTLTRKDVEVVLDTLKSQLELINQSNKSYYEELKQEVFKNNLQQRTEQAKRTVASYFRL